MERQGFWKLMFIKKKRPRKCENTGEEGKFIWEEKTVGPVVGTIYDELMC